MNTPISIPYFEEGIHYRSLSPKLGKYKYRFVTRKDIKFEFLSNLIPKNNTIRFFDSRGNKWLTIRENNVIISKNYAWNGCSPKRWMYRWIGTPDFEDTIIASLVHDTFIQFHDDKLFPLSRLECDKIFKNILHQNDFEFEDIYYIGTRLGSNILPKIKYTGKGVLTIGPEC